MRSKESAVSKDKGKCHKDNAERKKPDQRMQDWDSQAHSHAVVSLPTYHHKKNSCLGICPDRNTTNMTESPMHESPVIPRETWHTFHCEKAHLFCDTSQTITLPLCGSLGRESWTSPATEHTDSVVPAYVSSDTWPSFSQFLSPVIEDKGFPRLLNVMPKSHFSTWHT